MLSTSFKPRLFSSSDHATNFSIHSTLHARCPIVSGPTYSRAQQINWLISLRSKKLSSPLSSSPIHSDWNASEPLECVLFQPKIYKKLHLLIFLKVHIYTTCIVVRHLIPTPHLEKVALAAEPSIWCCLGPLAARKHPSISRPWWGGRLPLPPVPARRSPSH